MIRKATPDDAKEIRSLLLCTWVSTYAVPREILEREFTEEKIRRAIEDTSSKSVYLVKTNSEIPEIDPQIIGILRTKDSELKQLYILPGFQRKGVGTHLWNALPEKPTRVKVAVNNSAALLIYKKFGFVNPTPTNDFIVGNIHIPRVELCRS